MCHLSSRHSKEKYKVNEMKFTSAEIFFEFGNAGVFFPVGAKALLILCEMNLFYFSKLAIKIYLMITPFRLILINIYTLQQQITDNNELNDYYIFKYLCLSLINQL